MTILKANTENQGFLVLNKENSIVLPNFDTSSISEADVTQIILSLYGLDKKPKSDRRLQITINPFNIVTKEARDGSSVFIQPSIGQYVDFKLPMELFKRIIGTQERLLIRIVDQDQEIVFAGPNIAGTTHDPRLTITYNPDILPPNIGSIMGNDFVNISNSKIIFNVHYGPGDNVGGDKNVGNAESFLSKFLWQFIMVIIGTIVGGLIIAYMVFQL